MFNPFKRRRSQDPPASEETAAAPPGGYGFADLATQGPQPGQGLDALDGLGALASYWGQFGQLAKAGQFDPAQMEQLSQAIAAGLAQTAAMPQGATIDMRGDEELRAKIEEVVGHSLTPGTTESIDTTADPELGARIMQVVQEHYVEKARQPPAD